jgi:hypothetical protein
MGDACAAKLGLAQHNEVADQAATIAEAVPRGECVAHKGEAERVLTSATIFQPGPG